MAKDIKINNVTYNAVGSIVAPLSGGGSNATFVDTSDADATAADIMQNKTAYVNGSKLIGTAGSGISLPSGLAEMKSGSFKPGSDTKCSGYSISHTLAAAPKFFYVWEPSALSGGSNIYIENIVIFSVESLMEDYNQTTGLEGGKLLTFGKINGYTDVDYTLYLSTSSTRVASILGASAVQFLDVSYYFKANVTYYWIALR